MMVVTPEQGTEGAGLSCPAKLVVKSESARLDQGVDVGERQVCKIERRARKDEEQDVLVDACVSCLETKSLRAAPHTGIGNGRLLQRLVHSDRRFADLLMRSEVAPDGCGRLVAGNDNRDIADIDERIERLS